MKVYAVFIEWENEDGGHSILDSIHKTEESADRRKYETKFYNRDFPSDCEVYVTEYMAFPE